jgi:hypothetical protein
MHGCAIGRFDFQVSVIVPALGHLRFTAVTPSKTNRKNAANYSADGDYDHDERLQMPRWRTKYRKLGSVMNAHWRSPLHS